MEKKVYRSRISVLLLVVLIFAFLIPMFQCKTYYSFVPLLVALVFVTFILGGMRYVILENYLYVTMWNIITTRSVNIADIISVERTYNPLSSAAASLKRLNITFSNNNNSLLPFCLISPAREQEFIEDLKVINPHIDVNITPDKKGIWSIWDWDI